MTQTNYAELNYALMNGETDLDAVFSIAERHGTVPPDADIDDIVDFMIDGETVGDIATRELVGDDDDYSEPVDEAAYERMMLNSGDAGTHESLTY